MADAFYTTLKDKNRVREWYFEEADVPLLKQMWHKFKHTDPGTGQKYDIWTRFTNHNHEVFIEWQMPPDAPAGRYRIEVFIPSGELATTAKAIYQIARNHHLEEGEMRHDSHVWVVDQRGSPDQWCSLGEFNLDPSRHADSGKVRLVDLTREEPTKFIAFGPIRWVPLFGPGSSALRFDAPMGTKNFRNGPLGKGNFGALPLWHSNWYDATPFMEWYFLGYHTGADLNLTSGGSSDRGERVYAVADGKVTFAGPAGSWGNIVVIEHAPAFVQLPSGATEKRVTHSRYGHVENSIRVTRNDTVKRGDWIAAVGTPPGAHPVYHLHFDISHSGLLKSQPAHWPDLREFHRLKQNNVPPTHESYKKMQAAIRKEVQAHYVDPLRMIKLNRDI